MTPIKNNSLILFEVQTWRETLIAKESKKATIPNVWDYGSFKMQEDTRGF
jgi:hypothetical protein